MQSKLSRGNPLVLLDASQGLLTTNDQGNIIGTEFSREELFSQR